ncbi:hypothetical protein WA026_004805 [Henosepilachna vigintioctopunctata]|uniref:Cytochrome P450 n=1 Tax=Henosepilachna vigintioctopunctata TaxID=420089 RepID=A0AAW1UV66_9CUCU
MFIFNIIFSIFCFVVLRTVFLNIREWNRRRNIINRLPGPKGLPILGNYLEFRGDLKNVFKKMRIYALRNNHHKILRGWMMHFPIIYFFVLMKLRKFSQTQYI